MSNETPDQLNIDPHPGCPDPHCVRIDLKAKKVLTQEDIEAQMAHFKNMTFLIGENKPKE